MTTEVPEPLTNAQPSFKKEYDFFRSIASGSPFSMFNLSEKDVAGFYRRKNPIGVWHDGSPLIHNGELSSQENGLTKYQGTCYDQNQILRSQYSLFEGPSLSSVGEQMVRQLKKFAPGLQLSPSPNPTVFCLSQQASLPLHRDFDTGLRAIMNLDSSQTVYLDFEDDRLALPPHTIKIFPTGRWHGLNVHEAKSQLTVFTVCLISADFRAQA